MSMATKKKYFEESWNAETPSFSLVSSLLRVEPRHTTHDTRHTTRLQRFQNAFDVLFRCQWQTCLHTQSTFSNFTPLQIIHANFKISINSMRNTFSIILTEEFLKQR
jgi:hypothetical protein